MVRRSLLFIAFTLFISQLAFSQKESNIWYFGANAGVDFYSGKPAVITNSKMYASEGCAVQNTYSGRLLFYSDGETVWDSAHNIMPNGTGLKGSASSTQSVIIIPKPYSFNRYYIFTVDNVGGTDGVCYSEVNMSLNNGKGDVVSKTKNKKLFSFACEKISAVKHANGIDYWIMAHKFNSNFIYSYRVTGYGVIGFPYVSKTGFTISGLYSNTLGCMKFSPDGRKVAYANYTMDSTVIGDFDANTGKVSNVWVFPLDDAYGIEFSPKSKYLYVSEFSTRKIFQYDAKALSKQAFLASKKMIESGYNNDIGALQLGPDGKIYISVTGSSYLQVIHAPDSAGIMSRPQKDFLYLGGKTCLLGLPNFSPSIFNKKTILVQRNCIKDSTTFAISNINDLDSVRWNFGDPQSTVNTSKRITNVYHIYNKTGYYTVSLSYFYKKTFGWTSFKFFVRNPKPYIGKDTTFCNAFQLSLSPQRDYSKYKWGNINSSAKTVSVTKKGNYVLTITDSAGCISSDSLLVKNPTVKADFSISDTLQCQKNNLFAFRDISDYDDDTRNTSTWDFGDGTHLSDSMPKKEFLLPGTYKIKMNVESANKCKGTIEKTIRILDNPIARFTANSPCFPEGLQFNNESSIGSGKIIASLWDFGDNTTSSQTHPLKFYGDASKYSVKLLVISDNGCTDSITKHKGVWVKNKPKALFDFLEVSSFNNGKRILQFNNLSSADVISNYWDFGKGKTSTEKSPKLNYLDSGINLFKLSVTNDVGCSDTFSSTTFHKFYFYLPNAFSPNGNGINETFGPSSSLYVNSYKMEIYNQWGEKLFETTDLSSGWDGNYRGKACSDGFYLYKISLTPFNGVLEHYEGNMRLLR